MTGFKRGISIAIASTVATVATAMVALFLTGLWRGQAEDKDPVRKADLPVLQTFVELDELRNMAQLSTKEQPLTIVNIFGSWCGPCQIEHPLLMQLKENNIELIGIAYRDKDAEMHEFLLRLGNPYARVLWDPEGQSDATFDIQSIPATLVLDRDGTILWKKTGRLNPSERDELQQLVLGSAPLIANTKEQKAKDVSDLFWLAGAKPDGKEPALLSASATRPMDMESVTARLAERLRREPNDLEGWLLLGRAYQELDNNVAAQVAYEHALQLDPENEVARAYLQE